MTELFFFFFVLFVFRVEKFFFLIWYKVCGYIQNSVGDFFEPLDYQIASTQFFPEFFFFLKIPQGRARFSSPTR